MLAAAMGHAKGRTAIQYVARNGHKGIVTELVATLAKSRELAPQDSGA